MAAQDSNLYTPQELQKLYSFFKNFEKITSNPSISHTETLPNGTQVRVTNQEALSILRKHPDLRSFSDDSKLVDFLKAHRAGRSNSTLFNLYQAANTSIFNNSQLLTETKEELSNKQSSPADKNKELSKEEEKEERKQEKRFIGGAPLEQKAQEQALSPEKIAVEVFTEQHRETPKEIPKESVLQQALQSPLPITPVPPILVDEVPEYIPQPPQQPDKIRPSLIQRLQGLKMPKSSPIQNLATKVGIVIKKAVSKIPTPVTTGVILGIGAGLVSGGLPGAIIGATLGGVGGQYLASKMAGEDRVNKNGGLSEKAQSLADYGTRPYRAKMAKKLASNLGRRLAMTAGRSVFTNPWVLAAILILLIIIGLPLFDNLFTKPNALLPASRSGGFCANSDINQCLFYGQNGVGLQIGNPTLSGFITETANKVGIPSSILAGIARIETPDAFVSTDPTYFNNDYDSHPSSTNCCFGIMQFNPDTFKNTYNANLLDMTSFFNKTGGVKTDIISQTQYNDSNDPFFNGKTLNILRIYSVKDSIIDAAFKIRGDKIAYNGSGPWDRGAIDAIGSAYYGSCQDHYCDDLWLSYSNCQTSIGGGSCPVPNGKVIVGTEKYPENNSGHCGLNYDSSVHWCIDPDPIANAHYALDVQAPGGKVDTSITLPFIGNQSLQWKLSQFIPTDTQNPDMGSGIDYKGTDSAGNQYYLHFFHLDSSDPKLNEMKDNHNSLASGTIVANKLYKLDSGSGGPHLHFTISIYDGVSANYTMLEPNHDLHMCSSEI